MLELLFAGILLISFLLLAFYIEYLARRLLNPIIEKQYRQCLDKAKENADSGFKTSLTLYENNHIGYKTEKITKEKSDNHNNKT